MQKQKCPIAQIGVGEITVVLLFMFATPAFANAAVINGTTVAGNRLTITGTGFSGTPLTVTFNGTKQAVVSSTPTKIIATLKPVPAPGTYRLVVNTGTASATSYVAISKAPNIVAQVALTGQSEPIPQTTIFTPPAAGMYRVSLFFVVVASTETQGGISLVVQTTNEGGNGAGVCSTSAGANAAGAENQSSCFMRASAGAPISFYSQFLGVGGGTVDYEVFITVEQLQ